ncbi:hypothetical protein KEJ19_00600 [Candidatus Bathyarchaeota archaeon]|nr:hypothetical protein [Candidatus Bathyarchaeota archaeon]
MPKAMESAIEVSGITKLYRSNFDIDRISFRVELGEVFGLLGPSDARKTRAIRYFHAS